MFLALAFAAVMNFVSYFYSDKIALAAYRAQPVTREELPRAYAAVERLTQKIGIPMPKIYVIPTESPNAFATGRNPQPRLGRRDPRDSGFTELTKNSKACSPTNSATSTTATS